MTNEQPCFCLDVEAVAFYRECHGTDSCCNADEGLPCYKASKMGVVVEDE